jgi:ubiquinone biosynthesis protein UbiJ
MFFTTFTLPIAQVTINRLLGLDPEIQKQLILFNNKILYIEVKDISLKFAIRVNSDKLELISGCEKFNTSVRGNLLDLIEMAWKSKQNAVGMNKSIDISGDLDFLQGLKNILLKLEIDWEEQLSNVVGDVVAYNISKTVQNFCTWAKESITTLNLDLSEYLQEETRLLPTACELDNFMREVEILRDDVARLEAKIAFRAATVRECYGA